MRDKLDIENWRADAKCIGMDTEQWFPPRDKALYTDIADKAKAVCLGKDGKPACVVRLECLLYAHDNNEEYGIWGGLSRRERNALARKAAKHDMTLKEWVEKEI
jgi:WhiB family redox-sensing transcriptional regulator